MKAYLNRAKKVKSADPSVTIGHALRIINNLGYNAETMEISHYEDTLYSSHLQLREKERKAILFATNGKGTSRALAKASAYGELMERIQNMAFYMSTVYYSELENPTSLPTQKHEFKYALDEKLFTAEELIEQDVCLFQNLFGMKAASRDELSQYLVSKINWPQMLCIPFCSLLSSELCFLPFRFLYWIVGSNGMCAGNTYHEAAIQGISEILERFVLKEIYIKPFTPPDVPIDFFKGHYIYDVINKLQRYDGLRVVIKDFSLGIHLPVLGILVYSDIDNRYAFHLGADPSPVTALERCFTEFCQGDQPLFQEMSTSFPAGNATNSSFWLKQFHNSIQSYSGQWPTELFSNQADYKFNGFSYCSSNSDEQDFNYLLRLVRKLNYDVYMYDSSFLGFPTYYMYIPGMSEITNSVNNLFLEQLAVFEQSLPAFYKMQGLTSEDRFQLAQNISNFQRAAISGKFDAGCYFRHNPSAPVADMSSRDLLFSLHKDQIPATQPSCFDCSECNQKNCNYESMSRLCSSIKQFQMRNMKK